MSYNVTHWQQIRCSLSFDRATLQQAKYDVDIDFKTNRITIDLDAESSEMVGTFDPAKGVATITDVHFFGEGSGHGFDSLQKFLSLAKGDYEALIIWEGGDSISHLTVNNGVVQCPDLDVVKMLRRLQAAMELIKQLNGLRFPMLDPVQFAYWHKSYQDFELRMIEINNEQT